MYNKKLSKIYAGCAMSLALTMAAAPINVFAAGTPEVFEVNTVTPGTTDDEKTAKADDATNRTKIDPTAEDNLKTEDVNEAYTDTVIDVWGFTKDGTVYSVDVEWGAMTFEFETKSWDPETHKSEEGRGWLVYDNVNDKDLGKASEVQDAINRITVTNHSNASVYAKLTYAAEADYGETNGSFAALDTSKQTAAETASANKVEDFNATFDATKGVITLETADNAADDTTPGTPTVGNVYFVPDGIADDQNKAEGITQWTTIGKITVALSTTEPAETPVTPPSP